MKNPNIYLYGMITYTTALLLRGDFPQANGYSEVKEKHFFVGGETGGAAPTLASFGCKVKMDGNYMGFNTNRPVREFYNKIGVDVSRLHYNSAYAGVDEVIIIDKDTRTTFGPFAAYFEDYYSKGIIRWNTPVEEDIKAAKAAGIDPFFGDEAKLAAQYCHANNVPFVTIDERPEHEVCKLASVIVVSSDWIRDQASEYCTEEGKVELLKKYMDNNLNALVVITSGGGTILYGKNGEIKKANAFKIDTISTLGAGDTFKAGCIYGLSQGWQDDEIIKFSASSAAIACTKFPLPHNPPTLEEVKHLLKSN
jgi:sugar/nucleoside kinase (ribokinase family)